MMKKEIFFSIISKLLGRSSYPAKPETDTRPRRANAWGASGRKIQMDSGIFMQLRPFTSVSKFSK